MKTTEEKIAVMQGFVDGKTIQVRGNTGNLFIDVLDPQWAWRRLDYRIAPQTVEEAAKESADARYSGPAMCEAHRLAFKLGVSWRKEQEK